MLAITHFAVGATGGVLLWLLLRRDYRDLPVWLVFSGLWAMAPDVGKAVPGIGPNALHGPWGDVFWLHTTLDAIETAHAPAEGAIALGVLALAVLAVNQAAWEVDTA